jgi:protein transport protein SEC20
MIPDQQGEAARRELGRISSQFEAEVTGYVNVPIFPEFEAHRCFSLRKQVRSALLNAQRASNRSELFATKAKPNDEKESLSTEDALMKANQDVVSTLRRTLNLMQGELERSVLTTQLLG